MLYKNNQSLITPHIITPQIYCFENLNNEDTAEK